MVTAIYWDLSKQGVNSGILVKRIVITASECEGSVFKVCFCLSIKPDSANSKFCHLENRSKNSWNKCMKIYIQETKPAIKNINHLSPGKYYKFNVFQNIFQLKGFIAPFQTA